MGNLRPRAALPLRVPLRTRHDRGGVALLRRYSARASQDDHPRLRRTPSRLVQEIGSQSLRRRQSQCHMNAIFNQILDVAQRRGVREDVHCMP